MARELEGRRTIVLGKRLVGDIYQYAVLAVLCARVWLSVSYHLTAALAIGNFALLATKSAQITVCRTLITYVFSVVPRLLPYSMANLKRPLHTPRSKVMLCDNLTVSTPSVSTGASFGGA